MCFCFVKVSQKVVSNGLQNSNFLEKTQTLPFSCHFSMEVLTFGSEVPFCNKINNQQSSIHRSHMMLAHRSSSSLAHLTFSLNSCRITSVQFHFHFSGSSKGGGGATSTGSCGGGCSLLRQLMMRGMLEWNFIIFWWWLRHWRGERVLMQLLISTLILRFLRYFHPESNKWPNSSRKPMQLRFSASPQKDQLYFLGEMGGCWLDKGGGVLLRECLFLGVQLSSFSESEKHSPQLFDEEMAHSRPAFGLRDIVYAIFIIRKSSTQINVRDEECP